MSLRHGFQGLQTLLGENSRLLEIMADLEADLRFLPPGAASLEVHIESLIEGTLLLIEDLDRLAKGRFAGLYQVHRRIAADVRRELAAHRDPGTRRGWVLPLAEVGLAQAAETGAKAARLGELRRIMPAHAPDGFVVLASAYQSWMAEPSLAREMRALLDGIEAWSDRERVQAQGRRMREVIVSAPLHPGLEAALREIVETRFARVSSWAVRSSAVGEDGEMSFAGQFESVLAVPPTGLAAAYKHVVASRFSDRAVAYRRAASLDDASTPMAVLCIPLVDPRAAGVLYTRDPTEPSSEQMVVTSTRGLAADLVAGKARGDLFRLDRRAPHAVIASSAASTAPPVDPAELAALAELGLRAEAHFGSPQDLEWAIDRAGQMVILQSRPLRLLSVEHEPAESASKPFLSGGLTIFPGRAVAPALVATDGIPTGAEGVILVVAQATPELGSVIPSLAGLIAEQGHPTSHAATLLREFAVPSLFDVAGATERVATGMLLGLDASGRQVHRGDPWPDVRERTAARVARPPRARRERSAIHDLVLALNLTDPMARSFRPSGCRSIHDLIRFTHEKAVATFFEVGDREAHARLGASRELETPVPLAIHVLDVGGALPPLRPGAKQRRVSPQEVRSLPFQALWRGMSHPGISWAGRREISLRGLASVMATSLGQEMGSVRRLGEANYLLVAPDYLNLNIKLAYHYALVDALVGPALENNYVNFRFRGGGAAPERRDLRARFLAEVLRRARFSVDCRGDLVTAWLRRYPSAASEEGLELLGKLTVCARQLDMLMENESTVRHFVDRFLAGDYAAFA